MLYFIKNLCLFCPKTDRRVATPDIGNNDRLFNPWLK